MRKQGYKFQEVSLKIGYLPVVTGIDGDVIESGIDIASDILLEELSINLSEDVEFDWELDQLVESGKSSRIMQSGELSNCEWDYKAIFAKNWGK